MKQYRVTFYHVRNRNEIIHSVYYREFENKIDAKEWAETFMDGSLMINNYFIEQITVKEFLLHTA